MKLNIFNSPDETILGLAEYIVLAAADSIKERGRFSLVLSGGSTPKKLYELLASPAFRERIDWSNTFFFLGDERNVPLTNSASNYLMAKKTMFDDLQIAPANIFPINTALPPTEAAADYEASVNHYFNGENWYFDLILLGLGDNSHTASLFPHTTVLHDTQPAVKALYIDEVGMYRITLNAPLINNAHRIAFLVVGKDKAMAVNHILKDARDIENYPAQLIEATNGQVEWFMDEAAAK